MKLNEDKLRKWVPTFGSTLPGMIIILFGVLTVVGAEISILIKRSELPSVTNIPKLEAPLPQIIMLCGLWSMIPQVATSWLTRKIKTVIKGEYNESKTKE